MADETDDGRLGPAMSRLNERQRRFVWALLDQRKRNLGMAARKAGYCVTSWGGQRVAGHRLSHDERVMAAIQEEASRRLESSAYMAADVLVQIASNPQESSKERRAAAIALLDRSGHGASQNINVHKTVEDRTGAAMAARIEAFAKKLGMDPQGLLGVNAPEPVKVIDVTPAQE